MTGFTPSSCSHRELSDGDRILKFKNSESVPKIPARVVCLFAYARCIDQAFVVFRGFGRHTEVFPKFRARPQVVRAFCYPRLPVDLWIRDRQRGFEPIEGVGTQNLYGTPAYPDYDAEGDDRVVFSREL